MSSSYLLQSCKSFQIIVTNSLPQKHNTDFFGAKMEVVDISGMVSEYIRRSHYNESVSVLSSNYTPGLKEVFRQQHRQQAAASEVGIFQSFCTEYNIFLFQTTEEELEDPEIDEVEDMNLRRVRKGFRLESICWD